MQTISSPIESLLESAEKYNKTSLELLKLRSIDKAADTASTVFSRALLMLALTFFVLTLTIAISLWLGSLLGEIYYGFLIMAFVYGVIGIILFLCHPLIKKRLNNSVIVQLLN